MNGENTVEAGELQHRHHRGLYVDQLHKGPFGHRCFLTDQQGAQACTADIGDLGEIQRELPGGLKAPQYLCLELGTGVQLAGQLSLVVLVVVDMQHLLVLLIERYHVHHVEEMEE